MSIAAAKCKACGGLGYHGGQLHGVNNQCQACNGTGIEGAFTSPMGWSSTPKENEMNKIEELELLETSVAGLLRSAKNMQKQIDELKSEQAEFPKDGDEFWCISGHGTVDVVTHKAGCDTARKAFGNIFRTKEEATRHALRTKIFNLLWQQADGGDWIISNDFHHVYNEYLHQKWPFIPHYSTEEKARAALDSVKPLLDEPKDYSPDV